MSLDGNRQKLVKLLAQYDNFVTVNEMLENPEIAGLFKNDNSLRNALKELSFDKNSDDKQKHLKRLKEGRGWKYQVSDFGRKKISDWKQTEQDFTTESEEIKFGEAIRIFEEYFSEEIYGKIASAIKDGQSYIEVNLMNLDVFHPELYDYIRNSPENAMDAVEEALEGIDIVNDDGIEVRFYNLAEEDETPLSDISHSENIGKLISAEGVITYNGTTVPEVVSAIFECSQCGDHYKKEQDSAELKSPYKCDCGSRKFETKEKILTDSKVLKIQEQASKPNRRKVNTILRGELAKNQELEETSLGSLIKVNGVVKERPRKKNSKKLETYIEANSIEFKDKNRLDEIDESLKEEVRALAEDPEIKEKLKQTVAQGTIGGLNRVKEGYLLYRLGKTDDGNVHLLIAGEEGIGKSALVENSAEILPRTKYRVLKGTTEKGLTAAILSQDGDGYEIRAGDLVEADNGFFIGDEAGKFKESYNAFNTPMSKEEVNRSGAGEDVTLPASASVCLIMNPIKDEDLGRKWKDLPSKEDLAIKNDTDTLSRFDIQIGIPKQKINDGESSVRREIEKSKKVNQSPDEIETELDLDVYKAYLSIAEDIDPKIPPEGDNLLTKIYIDLCVKHYATSPRVQEQWRRLAKAYSRLRLEEEVSEERIWEAFNFWRECRATLYPKFREEDQQVSEASGFAVDRVERLENMIETLDENGGRMEKEELREELDLGGSESTQATVFADLIEAGLETEAVKERGQDLILNEDSSFLQNHSISQIIDEELEKNHGGGSD